MVALPDQLFYNTGISTYFWVVTNRKNPKRRGKIQLIDARDSWTKMRKSLGNKRKQISDEQITDLTRLYGAFEESPRLQDLPQRKLRVPPHHRRTPPPPPLADHRQRPHRSSHRQESHQAPITDATATGQHSSGANQGATYETEKTAKAVVRDALVSVTGEKPTALVNTVTAALAVRDPDAPVITDTKGNPKPDTTLRDYENVPPPTKRVTHETDTTRRLNTIEYQTTINDYLETEVHPYVPDAWHDPTKTKIGYEIPLTRHFYTYTPPRPLHQIDREIQTLEAEIQALLAEVTEA